MYYYTFLRKKAFLILILFYLNALTFVEKYTKNTRKIFITRKYIHETNCLKHDTYTIHEIFLKIQL